MVFEQTHSRDILKAALAERTKQNSRYSLRAMARHLSIQPSLLSELIRGNRKLTEETALKIADKLGMEPLEREYLRLLVQLERAKSANLREAILQSIARIRPAQAAVYDLTVDLFRTISDWHHFALLRLSEINSFEWTERAAAQALGITGHEVSQALERMRRLELIEIDASGRPRKLTSDLLVSSPLPNEALQKYHTQMLSKTAEALKTQRPHERFSGTEDLVLDPAQLEQANEIFENCFKQILELSKKRKGPSAEIYHLGIHFFKLTQLSKPKTSQAQITKSPQKSLKGNNKP